MPQSVPVEDKIKFIEAQLSRLNAVYRRMREANKSTRYCEKQIRIAGAILKDLKARQAMPLFGRGGNDDDR